MKVGASKGQVLNRWGEPWPELEPVEVEDGEELRPCAVQLKKAKPARLGSTSTIPLMLAFNGNGVAAEDGAFVV